MEMTACYSWKSAGQIFLCLIRRCAPAWKCPTWVKKIVLEWLFSASIRVEGMQRKPPQKIREKCAQLEIAVDSQRSAVFFLLHDASNKIPSDTTTFISSVYLWNQFTFWYPLCRSLTLDWVRPIWRLSTMSPRASEPWIRPRFNQRSMTTNQTDINSFWFNQLPALIPHQIVFVPLKKKCVRLIYKKTFFFASFMEVLSFKKKRERSWDSESG